MNHIELNAILFYSDFLSLKDISQPVTDNCKYFYIHGIPINSAFILGLEPDYDEQNKYFQQARAEYNIIKDKYGDEGVETFIDDICCIRACGCVDAHRMLNCIHQYSSKHEKKQAFNIYNNWKKQQLFTHMAINEDGEYEETECTKYVYHAEKMLGRPGLVRSLRDN